jgi:hypothetical protein
MRSAQIAGDAAECPFYLFANPGRTRVPQTAVGGIERDVGTGFLKVAHFLLFNSPVNLSRNTGGYVRIRDELRD